MLLDQNLNYISVVTKKVFKLFKLFLYARLDKLGLATTIKQAKRLVEEKSEVWDSLEHIIREHPIFKSCSDLHRLGVQAFELN